MFCVQFGCRYRLSFGAYVEMPELPEVEIVRRGLAPVMERTRFQAVELRRSDLRFPFPHGFAQTLAGREVLSLDRRAKYLLARLEGGLVLVMHLGMSGRFRIEEVNGGPVVGRFHHPAGRETAHDHVIFRLQNGTVIRYNDARRFGFMTLVSADALAEHDLFRELGPEPLSESFSADYLARRAGGRSQPLKSLLLDQRAIAGLGNIYACEALHRARLFPFRAASSLMTPSGRTSAAARTLVQAVRDVLTDAIAAGGSTLRDYRRTDGSLGYFQHSFAVYGRAGERCPAPCCGELIKRVVQNGRSTFYCPRCQR